MTSASSLSTPVNVETTLSSILKSYDRIGFGRRGVLDAEQEILRLAAGLSDEARLRFRAVVLAWIGAAEAERVAGLLHYNLPEHVRALAIRLCALVPIPDSLPLLQRLQADGEFEPDDAQLCREALREALQRLRRHAAPG